MSGTQARPSLALLLTGFLRKRHETFEALRQHVARHYDTTLFVATWDIADSARRGVREAELDPTPLTTRDVVQTYGDLLGDCRVRSHELYERHARRITARSRPYDLFDVNPRAAEHAVYWMDRLFAQWYIVRDGLQMITEHERLTGRTFDLICRTRTDILFEGDLPPWPDERVLVSAALPGEMPSDRGWIPDFFAIGPSSEMRLLTDVCYSIERMYDRQNVDTTNAENLLLHVLVREDIPISFQHVPFRRV